ncbi:unnamed protein product [Closterium sp. NIES-54]
MNSIHRYIKHKCQHQGQSGSGTSRGRRRDHREKPPSWLGRCCRQRYTNHQAPTAAEGATTAEGATAAEDATAAEGATATEGATVAEVPTAETAAAAVPAPGEL